jgi:glycine betaine/proline transport system permease protein
MQPTLDLMQTVPTFAYLIPILLLFGFGPVVGLIASSIYACPPMVRNVILGLSRVSNEVIEAGKMSGTTPRQLLWKVEIPSAMPTIMIGVNQSVMAALSMVIIAAIIGSSQDIGWEVLSAMRKAAFGESLLAGIVIALIAMIFDRIGRGFSEQRSLLVGNTDNARHLLVIAAILVAGFIILSWFIPVLRNYPTDWSPTRWLATQLNAGLDWVVGNHHETLDEIRNSFFFYFLLPLRVGLETSIRPHTWGFALTPILVAGYAILVSSLAVAAGTVWNWRAAVAVALTATIVYFGISKIPWPAFILIVTVIGWQVGGWREALLAFFGFTFIAVTGIWSYAMLSLYLCTAAVLTSFLLGGLIGVWAAHNDRVSRFVRPFNDTLQTMPLFVLLIPVLMFFQIGEFTAYLAIILYAIVPAIRYTEHGLRQVPVDIVDAAESMGCSGWQKLWQVKFPLAVPEIMLGLNQTIMFGLAMLVIASLVGTRGLGQQIYVALNAGDTGKGIVAGLGIALIAIVTDRMIQAWSHRQKAALGLASDE